MKRNSIVAMVLILTGMCFASLAPWPVQPEYYGVLAHWRLNDQQVAGAVAQYKLDDEAANTVVDNNLGTDGTWGHGNTDAHDAASWCANFGQSLEFDGTNDYIDTNQTFESTFQSSFSISMWVQPHDGIPSTPQAFMGANDDILSFMIANDEGKLWIVYSPKYSQYAEWVSETTLFQDGENNWHHLVIVFTEEDCITVFCDGAGVASDPEYSGDLSLIEMFEYDESYHLFIGAVNYCDDTDYPFDGRMDNVAIYDRALTAEDVAWLATCGTQSTESSMYTVEGSDADGKDLTAAVSISNLADPNGPITGCFVFDGTNDYLAMSADDDDLDFDTDDDFSISFWIKRDLLNETDRIVEKIGTSGAGWVVQVNQYGCMYLYRTDGTNWTATLSATDDACDGDWHHVVCVRTAGSPGKVYIDGVDDTSPYSNPSESLDLRNSAHLHVGCNVYHLGKLTGSLDDLIIFNRALTAAEAEALYERGTQEDYSRELANPEDDWRFWEDIRLLLWGMQYAFNGSPNEWTPLPLSEFQTGGDEANTAYAIGCLYLSYDGEIYVNKTAKALNTPLGAELNPSTSGDWYLAANPTDYGNWDKMQERWHFDGSQWFHGHDLLPTQMNPYCQSAGTKYLDAVQLPSPSSVSLTDAIIQEYVDAFIDATSLIDSETLISTANDTFRDWWEEILGETYDEGTNEAFPNLKNEFFNCNGSSLEFTLDSLGPSSYKWILITDRPASETDPDWLAFHPQWWDEDSEEWIEWSDPNDGYIQAVWRCIPVYSAVTYDHAATGQPKMWMGDASQEPPGLEGKTFRDRYIRCTYATRNDANPSPVPDCNSLTLAQVQSAYATQYGYWDDGEEEWVNGSVTYDGSQMYAALEENSDGSFTVEERRDVVVQLAEVVSIDGKPKFPPLYRTTAGNVGYSVIFDQRTMYVGGGSEVGDLETDWDDLLGTYINQRWPLRELNPNKSPWYDSGCDPEDEADSLSTHTSYALYESECRSIIPYEYGAALGSSAVTVRVVTVSNTVDETNVRVIISGGTCLASYELDFNGCPNQSSIYHCQSGQLFCTMQDVISTYDIYQVKSHFVLDVPCLPLDYFPALSSDGDPVYTQNYPWVVFAVSNTWAALPNPVVTGVNRISSDTAARVDYAIVDPIYKADVPYPEYDYISPNLGYLSPGLSHFEKTQEYHRGHASTVGGSPIYSWR